MREKHKAAAKWNEVKQSKNSLWLWVIGILNKGKGKLNFLLVMRTDRVTPRYVCMYILYTIYVYLRICVLACKYTDYYCHCVNNNHSGHGYSLLSRTACPFRFSSVRFGRQRSFIKNFLRGIAMQYGFRTGSARWDGNFGLRAGNGIPVEKLSGLQLLIINNFQHFKYVVGTQICATLRRILE